MKSITMTVLYQDLFNLHGDRGNIWAFEKAAKAMGVSLRVERVDSFSDRLSLKDTDILLCSSCELRVAQRAAEALIPYRQEIESYIEKGGVVVCTGHTLAVFAGETKRRDGSSFMGLSLVDAALSELRAVYSNDAVFFSDSFSVPIEVVGGQVQMAKVLLGDGAAPLAKSLYGYGNSKGEDEGVRYKNFIATNYQGPVFVKNPHFACEIIKLACDNADDWHEPDEQAFALEREGNERLKRFIELKVKKYDRTRLNNEE